MEAYDLQKIYEPEEEEPTDSAMQYRVEIFEAWCKSCGICIAFCPRECLTPTEEGPPVVSRPDLCTGCGWCEIHCPDFAISVRPVSSEKTGEEEEAE